MSDAKIRIIGENAASDAFAQAEQSLQGMADAATSTGEAIQQSLSADAIAEPVQQAAAAAADALQSVPEAAAAAGEETAGTWTSIWQQIAQESYSQVTDIGEKVGDGLKSAIEDPLGTLQSTLVGGLEGLGEFGVGVTAIGGAAVVAGKELFDLADSAAGTLGQMRSFGIVTGESVDQVSKLKYVADVSGSSLDQMQGLAFLLQKQLQATGPAADKFTAGLADLGINAEEFKSADLNTQILELSEGFQRGAASGNTMQAITEVLTMRGRQYADVLSKDLPEAFDMAQTSALGLSAQDEKNAEDFELAKNAMVESVRNLATTMGAELLPAITDITKGLDGLFEHMENAGPVIAPMVASLFGPFAAGAVVLGEATLAWVKHEQAVADDANAQQVWGAVQDTTNRLWATQLALGVEVHDATYNVADAMLKLGYNVQTVADHTGLAVDEVKQLATELKNAQSAADAYNKVWGDIAAAYANAGAANAPLSASIQGQIKDLLQLGFSHQEIAKALTNLDGSIVVTVGQVDALSGKFDAAKAATDKYNQAVASVVSSLDGEKKQWDIQIAAIQQVLAQGNLDLEQKKQIVDMLDKIAAGNGKIPPTLEAWRLANEDLGTSYAKMVKDEQTLEKQQTADLEKELKQRGEDVLAQLKADNQGRQQNASEAQRIQTQLTDAINKSTLDQFAYQRAKLTEWQDAQEGTLDYSVDGWQTAYNRIRAYVTLKLQEINDAEELAAENTIAAYNHTVVAAAAASDKQFQQSIATIAQAFTQLSQVSGSAWGGIVKDVGQGIAAIDAATKAAQAYKAAEAAGGAAGALGQIASGVSLVTSAVSLATTVFDALKSIGGPSQQELAGRQTEGSYEQQLANSLTATEKLQAGTSQLTQAVFGLANQYEAAGMSESDALTQANADMAALMAAERQGGSAVQTIITQIQARQDALTQSQAAVKTSVDNITNAWKAAGTYIPQSIQDEVKALLQANALTDAQKTSLQGLLDSAKPGFQGLQQDASALGLDISKLGPTLAQQDLDGKAEDIFGKFTELQQGGADFNDLLGGTADKFNAIVDEAMTTGTKVPENLQPILQVMANNGLLTDAAGNKMTDLSKISFEDTPLSSSLQSLQQTIQELVDTLNKVPGAASAAASAAAGVGSGAGGGSGAGAGAPPSYANEAYDLATPRYAIVGDAGSDSENVMKTGTVRQMVQASRASGAATAISLSNADVVDRLDSVHAALRDMKETIADALRLQPIMLRHALRGA